MSNPEPTNGTQPAAARRRPAPAAETSNVQPEGDTLPEPEGQHAPRHARIAARLKQLASSRTVRIAAKVMAGSGLIALGAAGMHFYMRRQGFEDLACLQA